MCLISSEHPLRHAIVVLRIRDRCGDQSVSPTPPPAEVKR